MNRREGKREGKDAERSADEEKREKVRKRWRWWREEADGKGREDENGV